MSDARAWIEDLETAVRQAAATIESLRRERDELADRVRELDARVGEIEAAAEGGPAAEPRGESTGGRADGGAAAGWREERREIRRRVERLTGRLEGLLERPE